MTVPRTHMRTHNGSLLFVVLGAALLLWAAPGCTPLHRHAVLDFFFDGVPPYRTPEERALARAKQEEARRTEEARRANRGGKHVPKLARFVHGPFAAKECGRCHDLAASSGFRKSRVAGVGSQPSADLAEAGRLRMPVNDLCVRCHTDFASVTAREAGLWMHGPVASGWCVLCHDPHSSRNEALLLNAPTARLCTRCHLPETLIDVDEHRPSSSEEAYPPWPSEESKASSEKSRKSAGRDDVALQQKGGSDAKPEILHVPADCIRCHDPHRGSDRLILRPRRQWQRAEVAPQSEARSPTAAGATPSSVPSEKPQQSPRTPRRPPSGDEKQS